MFQLGSSMDMLMLVSLVMVAWPAIITGAIIGWRLSFQSGVIELVVISLVGAIAAVAWEILSGFAYSLDEHTVTISMIGGYFGGIALGAIAQLTARKVLGSEDVRLMSSGKIRAHANYMLYSFLWRMCFWLCLLFSFCAIGAFVLATMVAYDKGIAVMLSYRLELAIMVGSAVLAVGTFYLRRWTVNYYRNVVWPRQTYT